MIAASRRAWGASANPRPSERRRIGMPTRLPCRGLWWASPPPCISLLLLRIVSRLATRRTGSASAIRRWSTRINAAGSFSTFGHGRSSTETSPISVFSWLGGAFCVSPSVDARRLGAATPTSGVPLTSFGSARRSAPGLGLRHKTTTNQGGTNEHQQDHLHGPPHQGPRAPSGL